jgi:sugar phosphate isomerase/epimerase
LENELKDFPLNRRTFMAGTSAALATATLPHSFANATNLLQERPYEYCTFIKFIQSLSYEQLADTLVEIGLDGAEVPVRKGGYIAPESASDELPKLAEVLAQRNLKINILTTDIVGVDTPHAQSILETAAKLGIRRYRMGFCRYDLTQSILPQVESLKPSFNALAALNRETGVSAVYQNHSGAKMMGATLWDLQKLIGDIPQEEIGCIFDVRHAVLEGGTAWPIYYDIIKPHIAALSVKDFRWVAGQEKHSRLKEEHTSLGEGQVDLAFFETFKKDFKSALITLHVEYLPKAGVEANIAAIRKDFATLRKAMGEKI